VSRVVGIDAMMDYYSAMLFCCSYVVYCDMLLVQQFIAYILSIAYIIYFMLVH
jgi:hypothetical protein